MKSHPANSYEAIVNEALDRVENLHDIHPTPKQIENVTRTLKDKHAKGDLRSFFKVPAADTVPNNPALIESMVVFTISEFLDVNDKTKKNRPEKS